MKFLTRLIILALFLSVANVVLAAENEPPVQELSKSSLTGIKIISSDVDKISLYLKGKNKAVYRISQLSQDQVSQIFDRFRNGAVLKVNTTQVDGRQYLDITQWE